MSSERKKDDLSLKKKSCVRVFSACILLGHMGTLHLQRPENGGWSSGTGITDSLVLTYGCWAGTHIPRKSSQCLNHASIS